MLNRADSNVSAYDLLSYRYSEDLDNCVVDLFNVELQTRSHVAILLAPYYLTAAYHQF